MRELTAYSIVANAFNQLTSTNNPDLMFDKFFHPKTKRALKALLVNTLNWQTKRYNQTKMLVERGIKVCIIPTVYSNYVRDNYVKDPLRDLGVIFSVSDRFNVDNRIEHLLMIIKHYTKGELVEQYKLFKENKIPVVDEHHTDHTTTHLSEEHNQLVEANSKLIFDSKALALSRLLSKSHINTFNFHRYTDDDSFKATSIKIGQRQYDFGLIDSEFNDDVVTCYYHVKCIFNVDRKEYIVTNSSRFRRNK